MNTDTIVTLVSSLGFPICCCVALGYFIVKYMSKVVDQLEADRKDYKEQLEAERKEHKLEVDNLAKVIENNTLVLQKILTKLGE